MEPIIAQLGTVPAVTAELSGVVIRTAPALQDKSVTPAASERKITADAGYDGLATVTVAAAPLEAGRVAPAAEERVVTPAAPAIGFSRVTVEAANLGPKTVTADGVYNAAADGLLGYSGVEVDTGALPPPSVGYVVKARDANGYPTAVDFYGSSVIGDLFNCYSTSQGPFIKLQTINFTSTVARINDRTFRNCLLLQLSEIEATGSFGIGSESFSTCLALGPKLKIKTPYIGYGYGRPFNGCTGLYKVWIGTGITTILAGNATGQNPFLNCTNLTDIYLEDAAAGAGFGPYWNYISASAQATVHYGVTEAAFDAL